MEIHQNRHNKAYITNIQSVKPFISEKVCILWGYLVGVLKPYFSGLHLKKVHLSISYLHTLCAQLHPLPHPLQSHFVLI